MKKFPFVHTDEEKAEALALATLKDGDIGKNLESLGFPANIVKKAHDPEFQVRILESSEGLSKRMDAIICQIVDLIPGKLENATLPQLTNALETLMKNSQLLKGNPTEITARSREERMDRLKEMMLKVDPNLRKALIENLRSGYDNEDDMG